MGYIIYLYDEPLFCATHRDTCSAPYHHLHCMYWSVFVIIKTDTVVIAKLNEQIERKMNSVVGAVSLVNLKHL